MTKNLTVQVMNDHCDSLNLLFIEGRSQATATLHSLAKRARQQEATDTLCGFSDERWDHGGGDAWRSRGTGGVWCRIHREPRKQLFTPFQIPRGPSSSTSLAKSRLTTGVTKYGQRFSITDDFRDKRVSHLALHEEWTGVTTFTVAPGLSTIGRCRTMVSEK